MTPNWFYFKLTDGNVYGFDHRDTSQISFGAARPIPSDELEWENIKVKKI